MSQPTLSRFADLAIAPPLLQAVEEVGYESPSPIQAQSIPPLLAGRDLLGQAQTGTGKTAAFALPLLSQLDLSQAHPQILVLAPTRELAIQVAEAMQTYARYLPGFHIATLYGGQNISTQLRQLRRGVHVVVGTPGRLIDHLLRGTLKLDNLSTVVLDEADEMLRMGFIEDVEKILDETPKGRQVALFSATMPSAIRRVAQRHLNDPVEIKIKSKTATVSTVTQRYWQVRGLSKLDALTRILEVEDFEAMLVFVRTKVMAAELAEKLEARGYSSAVLSGDISQPLREKTIERIKAGRLDIIVATDVAARGLDVERISHVINYDIPYDTETYVHRIGRTGRAGRQGDAILFVSSREKRMLRSIEQATRQPIQPMPIPSHADIADRRIVQFKQVITDTIEDQDLGFFEDLISNYQQEQDLSLREIAASLAYLVQKDKPLVPPKEDLSSDPGHAVQTSNWAADLGKPSHQQMQLFRIEVGRQHEVKPKNIVGAIANEVNLAPRYIGQIKLFDTFSTVYLPECMPKPIFQHLKQVRVRGQKLNISLCTKEERSRKRSGKSVHKGRHKKHSHRKAKAGKS
ncbi:DEAD/DEAH box helicase [Acaryochloris sp. CCMEE 5410]|uniref:DEAD/DEAH box helicase n=1 Tax=Acaryochloris sp. CCMEE 5410 TaxID=310037 RepID=UPI0002484BC2|nr:DEAD/DEAH box helicase [Acaryochloris sp. CCMEE 5410]KAI9130343.1 DEAD/DEAH box helicase [Acaryochloris sp. CCMEE 5410]